MQDLSLASLAWASHALITRNSMKVERKDKVPAEHPELLNPWRIICIALHTYLKLNHLLSCLLSFVKILRRFISLFLHSKANFFLLAHLSNVCHIKLFIIIAVGPNLEAQPECVFPHVSLHWLILFLGSNFLSSTSLLHFLMTHLWESHHVWYSSDECTYVGMQGEPRGFVCSG